MNSIDTGSFDCGTIVIPAYKLLDEMDKLWETEYTDGFSDFLDKPDGTRLTDAEMKMIKKAYESFTDNNSSATLEFLLTEKNRITAAISTACENNPETINKLLPYATKIILLAATNLAVTLLQTDTDETIYKQLITDLKTAHEIDGKMQRMVVEYVERIKQSLSSATLAKKTDTNEI